MMTLAFLPHPTPRRISDGVAFNAALDIRVIRDLIARLNEFLASTDGVLQDPDAARDLLTSVRDWSARAVDELEG